MYAEILERPVKGVNQQCEASLDECGAFRPP